LLGIGVIAALVIGWQVAAFASHPENSLAGSNFEIDQDANLKVNDQGNLDWASVTETRATDKVNGTGDDSYAGGEKEDTVCPAAGLDSVPPNKSDLLSFHVYREAATASGPQGYMNLAWSRVSEPNGTTLMDFEFNQNETKCAQGVNKVRTGDGAGPLTDDILIEYAIDNGGTRATISARKWTGSAWGPSEDLSTPSLKCAAPATPTVPAPCAAGSINSSPILAADSDGLITNPPTVQKNANTFGEAQIDIRYFFQGNTCTSFGSAMLKSRSSVSFTSALKDLVAPVGINLTNCANVTIRKETTPDGDTQKFDYTSLLNTSGTDNPSFQLADGESKSVANVIFGGPYTVTEALPTSPYQFDSIDCAVPAHPSSGVDITKTGRQISFSIDKDTDVVDCTYNNSKQTGAIQVTKTRKHAADGPGPHPQSGVSLTVDGKTKQTDSNGKACFDGLTFGNHDVVETVPTGYVADGTGANNNTKTVDVNNVASCSDTTYGGETVSFLNTPLTNLTVSVNSQVDGGTASTIDCDNGGPDFSTDANGDGSGTGSDLEPSTVTCKIVIDP